MKWVRLFIFCVGFMSITSGCAVIQSWFEPLPPKSEEALFKEGMESFRNEDYTEAIELFQELIDRFPYSPHTTLAELKIADAHFKEKDYDEAELAYETFEKLHPENENLPHVIYHLGLCHYLRMRSKDRDQTSTHKALNHFQRLISRFPSSEFSIKAKEKVLKARLRLAEHELYVARFYCRTGKYKAALGRIEGIQNNFGDIIDPKFEAKMKKIEKRCKNKLGITTSKTPETDN